MSRGVKIGLIIGTVLLVAGGGIGAAVAKKKHKAVEVRMDTVAHRDLVAAVTASGKIDAEQTVDISADITGRILQIAVKEGDTVRKGQFLVHIDPVQFQGAVTRGEALLAANEAAVVQARTDREQAKRQIGRESCR